MPHKYTVDGLELAITELSAVFDLVRVVEPAHAVTHTLREPVGNRLTEVDDHCHAIWDHRGERCLNCISMRAIQEDKRQTKYEFMGNDIFYVVSIPIEVDGQVLALEMVNHVDDRVLLNAYGVNDFIKRITAFNAKLHIDESTGLFNRQYYSEKLFLLCHKAAINKMDIAVAMLDVDGFEQVTRHFGPSIADEAIFAIGHLLNANVSHRRGDFVARYGANTYALVLDNIPRIKLRERLIELVQRITVLRLMGYEDVRLSVSMGVFTLSENRALSIEEITEKVLHRVDIARAAGFNRIAFSDQ